MLKRTVLLRRFFWMRRFFLAPTKYVLVEKSLWKTACNIILNNHKPNNFIYTVGQLVECWTYDQEVVGLCSDVSLSQILCLDFLVLVKILLNWTKSIK